MNTLPEAIEEPSELAIESRILLIRGHKVMLDRDLAELYAVPTKVLNQAVKRNIQRFPEDFLFQLTLEEGQDFLRSQIVTLEIGEIAEMRGRHRKYAPYVFTELGGTRRGHVVIRSRQRTGDSSLCRTIELLLVGQSRNAGQIQTGQKLQRRPATG